MRLGTQVFLFIVLFFAPIKLATASDEFDANWSIARIWNEALLSAIRKDLARPTVHSRNLFHSSAIMYDLWAVFDDNADPYFLGQTVNGFYCKFSNEDRQALRAEVLNVDEGRKLAISYAMRSLLRSRFAKSPARPVAYKRFDDLFMRLGFDINYSSQDYKIGTPSQKASALGLYLANCVIKYGLQDGANEQNRFNNRHYEPVNLPFDPKLAGAPGLNDPDRWQPLSFDEFVDQSGNTGTDTPEFVGAEWGRVAPFALSAKNLKQYNRDDTPWFIYHDVGAPATLNGKDALPSEYLWNHTVPVLWSAHLDPTDGVMWDISPGQIGNSATLPTAIPQLQEFYDTSGGGTKDSGHALNPFTNKPYAPQIVPRGDYTRVLAEFWADGPDSETPPGHWYTILNEAVSDHPAVKKQYKGKGPKLSDLEWDVKAYFILGGALHDSAVAAWGHKGWYDYVRPVSAIRSMAARGQSTDPALPNYHPQGIPLTKGVVELVKTGDKIAGPDGRNVGKIKVRAWRGATFVKDPEKDFAGVGWILAENWAPYQRPNFVTPPFAGYVSGHSTFSRAAAEVLTAFTGDEFFPGGMAEFVAKKNEFLVFEQGPSVDVVLQWATYRDASDQTSLSRIWGGIHPPVDDVPGRKLGIAVANDALSLADTYFGGSSANVSKPGWNTIGAIVKSENKSSRSDGVAKAIESGVSFTDVTEATGISISHRPTVVEIKNIDPKKKPKQQRFISLTLITGGAATGDFNNDGWMDLFVLGGGDVADALYINNQDGTFTDKAHEWGLIDKHIGSGVTAGDYNNDGRIDLFITSFGHPDNPSIGMHRLYRNNADGTFTNVAQEAGVNQSSAKFIDGSGAAFGDYDLDGDLDLFVAGWFGDQRWFFPSDGNRLFRNNGDGTFDDVTDTAGASASGAHGFSVCFADMNGDRFPEILLTADYNTSRYFVNNQDATFTDKTESSGTNRASNGMGLSVIDIDGDGMLDWLETSVHDEIVRETHGGDLRDGNKLYLNQGQHKFKEVAKETGLNAGAWGWGVAAFDANNDGFVDVAETNGFTALKGRFLGVPSKLWINNGDQKFSEVALEVGFNHDLQGRGLLYFDYDNDGDQDLVVTSNDDAIKIFRNDLPKTAANWLRIFLDTNDDDSLAPNGMGSRVTATARDRQYSRYLSGCDGYLSQSELSLHFGLGDAKILDELRIDWANGKTTIMTGVEINQTITIKSGN